MSIVPSIRGRLAGTSLDAALAAGADPSGSPEPAERSQHLTSTRWRARIAAQLDDIADDSHGGGPGWSAAVPPAGAAEAAAPALRRLAQALRAAEHADPRGVALALELVIDGASPLYRGPTVDDVLDAIAAAEAAL